MDIVYVSSDSEDSDHEYVKPIIKPNIEVSENLHQIINYPKIVKHSIESILAICNEIDLIDKNLQGYWKQD